MIITRTPLRISLLGGGTDMPSFYAKYPGCVVSFAISKYVYISVNEKFDGKFRISYSKTENVDKIESIEHNLIRETLKLYKIKNGLEITSVSDIPGNGTGLGSSSAFTVGLVRALEKEINLSCLAERAHLIEAGKCGSPVGKQDHYASAFGGMNHILFYKDRVEVTPILPSTQKIEEFESHALLLWTGLVRDANEILKAQDRSFRNGGNFEIGIRMANLARDFHLEFLSGMDMKRVGEFLQEGWKIKKFFVQAITNSGLDTLYDKVIQSGAYGGKLLGAGGGGFLFFLAPRNVHKQIVKNCGLRKIDFKIETEGSKVIYE